MRCCGFAAVVGAALLSLSLNTACTTVPTFRAPVDLPKGQNYEVGVGVQAMAGPNTWLETPDEANVGGGVIGFGVYRTPWPIDVFVLGHGTGTLGVFPSIQRPGFVAGGQLGIRGRVEAIQGLVVSLEGYGDYLEQNVFGKTQRHVAAIASISIAENVYGPLWVYIRPTGGVAISLYEGAEAPFFGVTEMPAGLTWRFAENFSIRAEAGYNIPVGAVSVAVAGIGTF